MLPSEQVVVPRTELCEWVGNARQRAFDLVADLTDEQLLFPMDPMLFVNPMLWQIGHMAWFQEQWVLRRVCGESPIRDDADALYDSIAVPPHARWDLTLPSREATFEYMRAVRDRVLERLQQEEPSEQLVYFTLLSVFHEDMHIEQFMYGRQALAYPPPGLSGTAERARPTAPQGSTAEDGALPGDVEVPGGTFMLGAASSEPFVFDNEKWTHLVDIRPFAIARAPVTQAEFAEFVDDDGYRRREFWSDDGWTWRESAGAEQPVYWRSDSSGWWRRHFDQWVPLEPHYPVIHVNWFEAQAYCRWAGRRLPTEPEWEAAAAAEPDGSGGLSPRKRRFPWGDAPPTAERANLDWRGKGCVDVAALPEGDSAFGCRQMIGNVWEWTSSTFLPYPGYVVDPYKEYSEPWFGTRKVLRGGCWVTHSRLLRNTWRNFYAPGRREVWAGFRTCPKDR